jgi:dTDP-4-dehydrorhamnose reductase
VRTNFFGWSPAGHGKTFGEWLYKSLKEQRPVRLITDYFFTPIEVSHFVAALKTVAESAYCGVINIAGTERCSKHDFGMAMAREFGFETGSVVPCTGAEMPGMVNRPRDLSLSTDKFTSLFGYRLPDVRQGLKTFRQNIPAAGRQPHAASGRKPKGPDHG